ncbi:hypothetical protein N9F08_01150, partial [bacterium]|nr:hypothetical protein [bacterium]
MSRRILPLLLILVLLVACSEEKRQFFRREKKLSSEFVLEMQHFFSESEDNMSFPVWFDDSLILEQKVKSIQRKIYNLNGKVEDFASLKVEKDYDFNEKGQITSVSIREFYEGQKVSDVTFKYSGVKDIYGYQRVKMSKMNTSIDDLPGYQLYEMEQTA